MNSIWEELYKKALSAINSYAVSDRMHTGSVASALLTKKGNIYTGICIDTDSSLGMCAERNAIGTMLTNREYEIEKIVSVYKDGKVIPSCGACCEFMMHLGGDVDNIEILLNNEGEVCRLIDLLPQYPKYK